MSDMLGRDLAVIDLPEVSSSFVTGLKGFPITAKGLRDPIPLAGRERVMHHIRTVYRTGKGAGDIPKRDIHGSF